MFLGFLNITQASSWRTLLQKFDQRLKPHWSVIQQLATDIDTSLIVGEGWMLNLVRLKDLMSRAIRVILMCQKTLSQLAGLARYAAQLHLVGSKFV